jgi:fatty-acyl-CoA synthase
MIVTGENLTFGGMLDMLAEQRAGHPAFAASDHSRDIAAPRRCSYDDLARDVWALQAALAELGIAPGDRVAVLLSSVPEWILYLFAVTRLGAIFLPVNPRFGSHELEYVLRHSGARALVAMGNYLHRDYATLIAEVTGFWTPGQTADRLPALQHIIGVRNAPHPEAVDTEELLVRGRRLIAMAGPPPAARAPDAAAILFYTSGTTAFPKGVPLSHANLLPHSARCGALLDLTPDDRILSLYPFFGISGGANKILSSFAAGACLVFQDAFRAEEAFALLQQEACGVVHAVDVQIRELVRLAEATGSASAQPPDRRGTIAFMAGLDEGLARRMGDVLGLRRFVHPYGMTETNPMILRNELDDPFEARLRPGGRIAAGVDLRVVDPQTGADQAIGVPGEIVVRGPTVTRGYFQDPGATASAFRDGWFHSGDLGVREPGGFVFYTGRIKDMLKVGGFNVAPQEVEEYLRTHAAVEDVAATGAPDARLGEVVVAFVKPRSGVQVSADELRDFCAGHLANFKTPRHIYLVDTLPYHTAANGSKLQRHVLRDWARERVQAPPD